MTSLPKIYKSPRNVVIGKVYLHQCRCCIARLPVEQLTQGRCPSCHDAVLEAAAVDDANTREFRRTVQPAIDRDAPNWGQTHPLPELEGAITLLNQLRAEPRHGDTDWEQTRTAAFAKAARLLEVPATGYQNGHNTRWNAVINALDHYRAGWRGEVVSVRRVEGA